MQLERVNYLFKYYLYSSVRSDTLQINCCILVSFVNFFSHWKMKNNICTFLIIVIFRIYELIGTRMRLIVILVEIKYIQMRICNTHIS
jgi:hypothetical protein